MSSGAPRRKRLRMLDVGLLERQESGDLRNFGFVVTTPTSSPPLCAASSASCQSAPQGHDVGRDSDCKGGEKINRTTQRRNSVDNPQPAFDDNHQSLPSTGNLSHKKQQTKNAYTKHENRKLLRKRDSFPRKRRFTVTPIKRTEKQKFEQISRPFKDTLFSRRYSAPAGPRERRGNANERRRRSTGSERCLVTTQTEHVRLNSVQYPLGAIGETNVAGKEVPTWRSSSSIIDLNKKSNTFSGVQTAKVVATTEGSNRSLIVQQQKSGLFANRTMRKRLIQSRVKHNIDQITALQTALPFPNVASCAEEVFHLAHSVPDAYCPSEDEQWDIEFAEDNEETKFPDILTDNCPPQVLLEAELDKELDSAFNPDKSELQPLLPSYGKLPGSDSSVTGKLRRLIIGYKQMNQWHKDQIVAKKAALWQIFKVCTNISLCYFDLLMDRKQKERDIWEFELRLDEDKYGRRDFLAEIRAREQQHSRDLDKQAKRFNHELQKLQNALNRSEYLRCGDKKEEGRLSCSVMRSRNYPEKASIEPSPSNYEEQPASLQEGSADATLAAILAARLISDNCSNGKQDNNDKVSGSEDQKKRDENLSLRGCRSPEGHKESGKVSLSSANQTGPLVETKQTGSARPSPKVRPNQISLLSLQMPSLHRGGERMDTGTRSPDTERNSELQSVSNNSRCKYVEVKEEESMPNSNDTTLSHYANRSEVNSSPPPLHRISETVASNGWGSDGSDDPQEHKSQSCQSNTSMTSDTSDEGSDDANPERNKSIVSNSYELDLVSIGGVSWEYCDLLKEFQRMFLDHLYEEQAQQLARELNWLRKDKVKPTLPPSQDSFRDGSVFDHLLYEESFFIVDFQKIIKICQTNEERLSEAHRAYFREKIIKANRTLYEAKRKLDSARSALFKKQKLHWAMTNSSWNCFPILQKGYRLLNLLGKGGFAEVWEAFDPFDLKIYAAKLHILSPDMDVNVRYEVVERVKQEIYIHHSLNSHKNIVNMQACFEMSDDLLVTILELCNAGDLDNYFRNYGPITEALALPWTKQILEGLIFMKTLPAGRIHHCDLKPGNILLHKGNIKLADFGLSRMCQKGEKDLIFTGAGTMWYQPPECYDPDRTGTILVSDKLDIWAVGCILFEGLCMRRPFGSMNITHGRPPMAAIMQEAKNGLKFTPAETERISPACRDLLASMLAYESDDRPSIEEALAVPILAENSGKAAAFHKRKPA